MRQTLVLWFTGLSGAGKTTIANRFLELMETGGKKVKVIDGDVIRSTLHRDIGFTHEDIKKNNRLIAELCQRNLSGYDYIVVSIIAPFIKSRQEAREIIGRNFVEVYVKVSLDEAIRRDAKGLYKKALRGEIDNFIGISPQVPYEPPSQPDIVLDTEKENPASCVEKLIRYSHNFLGAGNK